MAAYSGSTNIVINVAITATGTLRRPEKRPQDIENVLHYLGEKGIPRETRRRRHFVMEAMRNYGTPIVVKHMYNADDIEKGIAEPSPNFSDIYKQTRHDDPISYGVGYVSVEKSDDEWMTLDGSKIIYSRTNPGPNWIPAPKYRGFGPGYLTYVIEPDIAEDVFKLTETGVLIKTQSATATAPWYPEMNDNDLLVNVVIDKSNRVLETNERYQLKMSSPVSMRGINRRGRREYTEDGGNRFVVNQTFEMALVPDNNVLYKVPIDR